MARILILDGFPIMRLFHFVENMLNDDFIRHDAEISVIIVTPRQVVDRHLRFGQPLTTTTFLTNMFGCVCA